jgi:hypothetical protein
MWVYGFFTIYILLGLFLTYYISEYHLPYRVTYNSETLINLK